MLHTGMPDHQSTSSFIPKRSSNTTTKRRRNSNFFVLSIISYACLIAAPTASAAVYVYKIYNDRQFNTVAEELLNSTDKSFSQAALAEVIEFDSRLQATKKLLDHHASIGRVLSIIEANTAVSVNFTTLNLTRDSDTTIVTEADIVTDGFDSAIFQRGQYLSVDDMSEVSITEFAFIPASETEGVSTKMVGTFTFDVDSVVYDPNVSTTITTDTASDTTAESTDGVESSSDLGDDAVTNSNEETI